MYVQTDKYVHCTPYSIQTDEMKNTWDNLKEGNFHKLGISLQISIKYGGWTQGLRALKAAPDTLAERLLATCYTDRRENSSLQGFAVCNVKGHAI